MRSTNRNRQRLSALATGILTAWGLGVMLAVSAAPASVPAAWQAPFDAGVEAYRDGHFDKAMNQFRQIVLAVPESAEGHYYLAISLAQLGRFREARAEYQTVMRMAPGTESARLAQQGIEFLPDPDKLDAPPRVQQAAGNPAPAPGNAQTPNQPTTPAQAQTPFGNMDAGTLQMMLMMSSMGGGGNGGGMNPMMMLPFLQGMTAGGGNAEDGEEPSRGIPPEAFSSMMMNQMLQNFSPFGSDKDE